MKNATKLIRGIGPLLAICVLALPTAAAPITFRFDAEIASVSLGIPFDSGVEFAVGDTISGEFTFDPLFAPDNQLLEVIQPYAAKIFVDEATFVTPASVADFTLRSFNDGGISDFPPATMIDSIVTGGSLGPADPVAFPNIALIASGFRITLWGDTSILDAPGFPADPAVWNSFQFFRRISVSIRSKSGQSQGFSAIVGDFVIVPEPNTISLTLLIVSTLAVSRLRFPLNSYMQS